MSTCISALALSEFETNSDHFRPYQPERMAVYFFDQGAHPLRVAAASLSATNRRESV
jgi:hypothetical protein